MNRSVLVAALLLILPAHGEDVAAPCVIPRGPPCLTLSELREKLDQGHCVFEEQSCIVLQWDEYTGSTIIEAAVVKVTPSCSSSESAAAFEKRGREYLSGLQTIPIEVTVEMQPCAKKGVVDVKITKTRSGNAP